MPFSRRFDTPDGGPYRNFINISNSPPLRVFFMPDSNPSEAQVKMLADLVGIPIDDAELPEIANRFASLMQELDRLRDLDLEGIEPVSIFPDTDGAAQ